MTMMLSFAYMTAAVPSDGRRSRGRLVIGVIVTAMVVAPMVLGAYLGVRRASSEAAARERAFQRADACAAHMPR